MIIVHGLGNHRQLPANLRYVLSSKDLQLLFLKPRPHCNLTKPVFIQEVKNQAETQKMNSKMEWEGRKPENNSAKKWFVADNDPNFDNWKENVDDWKALAVFLDRIFFSLNLMAVVVTYFYFNMTIVE